MLVRLDGINVEALCLPTNEGELDLLEAFNRSTRDREGVDVLPASALEALRHKPRAKMFHTPTVAIVGDRAATRPRPIVGRVSDARAALAELGLGFVGDNRTARTIEGKKPVASFLNGRVEFLADRIITRLAGLDRVRTVQRLLEHLVAKRSEAQQDEVTTAATLAAYGDGHDAEGVLLQRWQDRSAVSLIPRLLVEVAICEAAAEGGSRRRRATSWPCSRTWTVWSNSATRRTPFTGGRRPQRSASMRWEASAYPIRSTTA